MEKQVEIMLKSGRRKGCGREAVRVTTSARMSVKAWRQGHKVDSLNRGGMGRREENVWQGGVRRSEVQT